MKIQELQRMLNHSEPKTRDQALAELMELCNHEAYGLLMFAASNHFSPDTRRESKKLSLLLQKRLFGQDETFSAAEFSDDVENAFEKIKSAESNEVRAAIKVLMAHNSPAVFQRFAKELHQIQRPEVLPYLLLGLGRIGKEESVPYLVNYLRSNNETIRASVIRALNDIGSEKNLSLLVRFSRDPSTLVRQEVLGGLTQVKPDILLQTLKDVINTKGDFHKEAALYVIARLKFLPGLDLVKSLHEQADENAKERTRKVLELLDSGASTKTVAPVAVETPKVTEPEPKPIETPLEIPTAQTTTEPEVEDEPPGSELQEQEENALRVVRQGEESSAIKGLFTLIEISRLSRLAELEEAITKRDSKKVLATYIMAIAQSHDKSFKEYLLNCLQHDDPRVQANSIEALRMIGCADVKQQILPFVNSRNDRTRGNAIVFLHATGLIDTEQELSTMLQSKSDNRKLSAIFSMAEIFDPFLIPLLEIPMDSPNPRVSKRAMDVLRMYVLEDHPKAVEIAKNWNIYEEMLQDSGTNGSEPSLEETEDSSTKNENEVFENLAEEIVQASEKKQVEPEREPVEQGPSGTMDKIKSFMGGLLKKKGKD